MSFFLLDMFIGVMVDTFHHCQLQQKRRTVSEGRTAVLGNQQERKYNKGSGLFSETKNNFLNFKPLNFQRINLLAENMFLFLCVRVDIRVSELEQIPYYENYSKIRQSIHTFCTSNTMERIVTVIIFSSVIIMAVEHYKQPKVMCTHMHTYSHCLLDLEGEGMQINSVCLCVQYIEMLIEYSFFVFTALLIIEVLLKLLAFGVWRFIKFR